jgi:Transposase DDE domain
VKLAEPPSRLIFGNSRPPSVIPYGSEEWKRLYRGRAAVEREFGRLKNEYALPPLRTRGLARVRQNADLVMFARLGRHSPEREPFP